VTPDIFRLVSSDVDCINALADAAFLQLVALMDGGALMQDGDGNVLLPRLGMMVALVDDEADMLQDTEENALMPRDIFIPTEEQKELVAKLLRFWPFSAAPQNPNKPYGTWQVLYGSPENSLNCAPSIDSIGVQVDLWGDTVSSVRSAAEAVRRAVEKEAHVVALNGETREPDTRLFRVSFSVDFYTKR